MKAMKKITDEAKAKQSKYGCCRETTTGYSVNCNSNALMCVEPHIIVHLKKFLPYKLLRATKSCLLIWALKISKSFSTFLMS